MPRRLENAVALIAAACSGIGADTARALAAEGATVALVAAGATASSRSPRQSATTAAQHWASSREVEPRPDLLFASSNHGLQQGTRLTPQRLTQFTINTLAHAESYAHLEPSRQSLVGAG
jgi:NAD(P)-dependent dehydrogenase (short-subunit alcohol dehydrogenase family)